MSIATKYLGVFINKKVLSGGEEILVKRLAKKAKMGNPLSPNENNFIFAMAWRSNMLLN